MASASRFSIMGEIGMNTKPLSDAMKNGANSVTGFGRKMRNQLRMADFSAKKLSATMQSIGAKTRFLTLGIFGIGAAGVKAAADFEMLQSQFTVMLGSGQKASVMMSELKKFSASTPFQLEELAKGSQQLLSFGVAQENIIDTMRMLGDTAGGNSEKLNGLVLAYGKVQVKGKASMEEMNMMAERGIPIFDELSKVLGVKTKDELFKLSRAGKISSEAVTQAFKNMTSSGGMFFEGMKTASETTAGKFSTMKDNVKLLAANFGELLLPTVNSVILKITELSQIVTGLDSGKKKTIVTTALLVAAIFPLTKGIQGLIAVYQVYTMLQRLGLFLKIKQIALSIIMVAKIIALSAATGIATTAQWAFNAALNANPIGLIVIGILATIAVTVLLIKYWDQVTAVFEEWGFVLKWVLGPIAILINLIQGVIKWWGLLRDSFQAGGIVGALREIGVGIFNSLVLPIRKALELMAMIPGVGVVAQKALDGLTGFQSYIEQGTVQGNRKTVSQLNDRFGAGIGKGGFASPESGSIASGSRTVTQNGQVDVNVNAPGRDTTVETKSPIPGLSVNLGEG